MNTGISTDSDTAIDLRSSNPLPHACRRSHNDSVAFATDPTSDESIIAYQQHKLLRHFGCVIASAQLFIAYFSRGGTLKPTALRTVTNLGARGSAMDLQYTTVASCRFALVPASGSSKREMIIHWLFTTCHSPR